LDLSNLRISGFTVGGMSEAKEGLFQIGVDPREIDSTARRMLHINVKVKDLPKKLQEAIEDGIKESGGYAVLSKVGDGRIDLLLFGTIDDFYVFIQKIKDGSSGLMDLGGKIDDTLRNYLRAEDGDFKLHVGGYTYDLRDETLIMGVINVTPDSFSDGGRFFSHEDAVKMAGEMAEAGAHIIDIGGESTRPGSEPVSLEEELGRVIPVIETIQKKIKIPISIDTYKAEVAEKAVGAGASMINDISGLRFDPKMAPLAAKLGVPVVLMHIKGTPRNMQKDPTYEDLVPEIIDYLEGSMGIAIRAGIDPEKIIVDPGIGFGKTWDDNLKIIRRIRDFYVIGRPILVGASRKAFIGGVTKKEVDFRLWGSIGAAVSASAYGAHMVRVHDVEKTRDALLVVDAVKRGAIERDDI
jgi:dihydropteroate synthase